MRAKRVVAGLLGLSGLLAASAWAGIGGYLKIEGIPGKSADAEHPQWIPLSSFSWNDLSRSALEQNASYGQSAPRKGPGTLTITRAVADAIPALKELCGSKRVLPEMVLSHPRESLPRTFLRSGEGELRQRYPAFIQFKMTQVSVGKCVHVPGAEGEVMALNFEGIEWLNIEPPKPPAPTGSGQ